jgi:tRNA threonylcarbamoyladenosine biosynthesis protein TsaB
MNILHIDTRDNKRNLVRLETESGEFVAESSPDKTKGDVVLKLIQEVCLQANISVNKINKIYCEKGPGSFTGLRVGFAIANALSLALLVPINDNKIGTIDTPIYE